MHQGDVEQIRGILQCIPLITLGHKLHDSFRLEEVLRDRDASEIQTEIEFMYPVRRVPGPLIKKLFEHHVPVSLQQQNAFNVDLPKGFFKGYIDMGFQYKGRYYLIDWKSNDLGNTMILTAKRRSTMK